MNGFTLIETLVSISVISVLFLVGFAGFREFATRNELLEATKLVKQELLLAAQRAASGEKPIGCTNNLNSYVASFVSSSFEVIADCGTPGVDAQDLVIKKIDFTGGITKVGSAQSISFKVLSLGIEGPTQTITLQNPLGRQNALTITTTSSVY